MTTMSDLNPKTPHERLLDMLSGWNYVLQLNHDRNRLDEIAISKLYSEAVKIELTEEAIRQFIIDKVIPFVLQK